MKAAVGAIQEKSAGELHRQRAGAFGGAMADHVAPGGLQHAREIHAPVLLEVLVFGGDDRVVQHGWNLAVGDQNAPLERECADGLAVVGVKLRHDDRPIVFQRVNFGQIARVNEQQADGRAQRDRTNHQK